MVGKVSRVFLAADPELCDGGMRVLSAVTQHHIHSFANAEEAAGESTGENAAGDSDPVQIGARDDGSHALRIPRAWRCGKGVGDAVDDPGSVERACDLKWPSTSRTTGYQPNHEPPL
ncbi:hypothetical protein GCM10023159_08790 [Brevibacterium yomogidense]